MYSAGVLICKREGDQLYFLLGRDSKYKTWSDFGGKNESVDKMYPEKTAAREFYEESCGTIYSKYKIRQMLKHKKPYLCSSYLNNPYYMYLIYDGNATVEHFEKIRNLLLKRPDVSFKFLEKDKVKWFDYDYIKNNPDDFRCVFYKSLQNNIDTISKNA